MNIEAKNLKKILANWAQQYIKRLTHHNQMDLLQGGKDGSTYGNQ